MTTLKDAPAREAIANAVDRNIVVEAAAGTGKTTSLVARLMTLFRRGALAGDERLAAVTFTHKAAAELRERLESELARALDAAPAAGERRHLEAARDALGECHIGTIHSFCARLLRERPVEAGVSPDFRELDETGDLLLRRRAWREFAAELARGLHSRLYGVFETFGIDLAALGRGFETFAEFPDVGRWPGDDRETGDIDVAAFLAGVDEYHESLAAVRPLLDDADPGNDALIPVLRLLCRRLPRLRRPIDLPAAHRLAGLFRESPRIVQKQWKQFGMDADDAREATAAYARFYDGTVKPFRESCLAASYRASLEAFRRAEAIYSRLRRDGGVLNFQDLLMRAAAMLRNHPRVRRDLAGRYARLLVDEVQDTDPVQAEIMFLLAATEGSGGWRERALRPGALFLVGDPKQSIYRFRRADIEVYQEMKRIVRDQGGEILGLSTNFRSDPGVVAWVNGVYGGDDGCAGDAARVAESGRFGREDSEYGPGYIPLEPGREPAPDDSFHGVYALETIAVSRKDGVSEADLVRDEAARIASFIRGAVDAGLPIATRTGARPARAGDFLVVTYKKKTGRVYAEALRRLGLSCRLSCGGALADSPALRLLAAYLGALACPDDPVLLLAVLRGGMFGVSDVELYRWKKAGGGFTLADPIPEVSDSPLPGIMALMARHLGLFRARAPLDALREALDDLGLWAYACLGDDPSLSAGVLATALELLGARAADLPTLGDLVEGLEWLMENHEDDPLPILPATGDAVRVMNVHKTKGLEAPVVFLASTRNVRPHPPAFCVRRDAGVAAGFLAVAGGEHGERLFARPPGWEETAARESLFLAAERTRLNYVAATRAGSALVVSISPSGKGWQSAFLPACDRDVAIERRLPEPPPAVPPPAAELSEEAIAAALDRSRAERDRRRRGMLIPSYGAERAKPGTAPEPVSASAAETAALDFGEVLHRLLASDLPDGRLAEAARELIGEYGLSDVDVDEAAALARAVRASAVWARALRSERMFREAPFAVRVDDGAGPVLRRGVIDLVFREAGGWVVVDYKSDRPGAAADAHREQLAAYASAWEAVSGEPVVETGIYFVRSGEYVIVDVART